MQWNPDFEASKETGILGDPGADIRGDPKENERSCKPSFATILPLVLLCVAPIISNWLYQMKETKINSRNH